jgi:hypothetical protein
MNVSNEGICLDMRKYFISIVQINLIFPGQRALENSEKLLNERCLK